MKVEAIAVAVLMMWLLATTCSADDTVVMVELDKQQYQLGESFSIHLIVKPDGKVGGRLLVYRNHGGVYKLKKSFFEKPTPAQCLDCAGMLPLSNEVDLHFEFEPKDEGTYMIEANYGGTQDKKIVEVTEAPDTNTPTPSSPSSTIQFTTTTSSTTTTTTSIAPTSTTNPPSTTASTLPAQNEQKSPRTPKLIAVFIPLLAIIIATIAIAFSKKKSI